MTDVVCVGGSVAGAATAGFLARAGKRVIVLDRAEFPRWKACGEGILPHGSAVLDRLGVDLPDATTIRGIRFAVARGSPGSAPVVSAWLPFPGRAGRALSRHVLDAAIRSRASSFGVEFVQARAIRIEPGRVVTDRGIFEAPLLIGADGSRSLFHECLGVRVRPGRDRVGFSTHWEGALTEPGEVNVTAFRGGELYVAPVDGGLTLAALLVERRFFQQVGVTMRGIPAFLRERFPDRFARARRAGPILGAFPLASRVSRVAAREWLLVGDAAGAIDPISGEGLSLALCGAEIASAVILEGWDPDRYAARMRALRRPIERLTGFMLFLARHPRLAGVLFRHEKRLAPMMRVAVGES